MVLIGQRSQHNLAIDFFKDRVLFQDVQTIVHFTFTRERHAVETQPLLKNRHLKHAPEVIEIASVQIAIGGARECNQRMLQLSQMKALGSYLGRHRAQA